MNEVGSLFHSKAREKLMEHLEEGGEELMQKVLNFIEYGLEEDRKVADLRKPFHRNIRTFAQLSLEHVANFSRGALG